MVAVIPGALFLVFTASLAFHMHRALGGWPNSIGTHNFPEALAFHADVEGQYSTLWFLVSIFLLPILQAVTLLVRPFRRASVYLGGMALFNAACLLLFGFAPDGFLYWWWD